MVSLKTYKKSLLTLILCCALVPSSSSASFWHSWLQKHTDVASITASTLVLAALGFYHYLHSQYQDHQQAYNQVDIQEAFHEAILAEGCPKEDRNKNDNLNNIKLLIGKGADINKASIYLGGSYETPLYFACYYSHLELAQLLIEHGADVNKANENTVTPLHCAACYATYDDNLNIIHLLTQNGAHIDTKNWQSQPRMHSTSRDCLDQLEKSEQNFNTITTPATPGLLQRLIACKIHDEYVLKHFSKQNQEVQKQLMFHALLHNTRILIKMVYYSYANHNELLLKPQMLEGNTYLQQKYEQFLKKVTHY